MDIWLFDRSDIWLKCVTTQMEVRPANSSDCPNLINQSIIYYYAKYH